MVGRRWPGLSRALARVRWPLAGLAALVLILACVLVIPQWLVRWELGAQVRTLSAADKAKATNDVRTTLLQGIGGAVLLLGAFYTYQQVQTGRRQLHLAQQGQVTERFTRAIDQLGSDHLDVQLGGIYALERIARDSPDDRDTIGEVLTVYIRRHAPWPPRLDGQPPAEAAIEDVPELQVRAPDVQACLTVLGRGGFAEQPPELGDELDLHEVDLRKAYLLHANLVGASLYGANLAGAVLAGVNLTRAYLSDVNLARAEITGADFTSVDLALANLEKATLEGAILDQADLGRANLSGALLERAELEGAHLEKAVADGNTKWPQFFDPVMHGVKLNGELPDRFKWR
ncbi:MAG TPA: pentapeptide repeat-containing protein [Actinomycetes bacterium]